jgi:hypothetical protein
LKISCVSGTGPPQLIFEGTFSAAQLEHAFDSAISGPGFVEGMGVGLVIDTTHSESDFSHDEIKELAYHIAKKQESFGCRLALVVSPAKLHHYGLARMFSTYAELRDLIVGVFTSSDEALRWLRA